MGLFYLKDKDRYCLYNFKTNEVLQELYGGETVKVLIDNKVIYDIIGYKNKNWYLEKSGYIGQDLNGLDIVTREQNLIGALKKVIKNIFQ